MQEFHQYNKNTPEYYELIPNTQRKTPRNQVLHFFVLEEDKANRIVIESIATNNKLYKCSWDHSWPHMLRIIEIFIACFDENKDVQWHIDSEMYYE